nr:hypothetical protein [Actinophytocola oryzae]
MFGPDGNVLALGSIDTTVALWDVRDPRRPELLGKLTGHTDRVDGVAWRPDGRTPASASLDRTVRLWDVTNPRRPHGLATMTGHTDRVYSVAFAPDGTRLVTASEDRTARLWLVDVDRVASRLCASSSPRVTEAQWEEHFTGLPFDAPCP